MTKRTNNAENVRRLRQRFPSLFGEYSPLLADLPIIDNFQVVQLSEYPNLSRAFRRRWWWEVRDIKTATAERRFYLVDRGGTWYFPNAQTTHPPYNPERLIHLINRQAYPPGFCRSLAALVVTDKRTHIMGEPVNYDVHIFPLNLKGVPRGNHKIVKAARKRD